jgi:hypothetical protein
MINPADPRYAWVALYSRADGKSTAHVVVLVVNRSDPFDASRVNSTTDPYSANKSFKVNSNVRSLEPRKVLMQFVVGTDAIQITSISSLPGDGKFNANAAAPNGFVVIAPDFTQIPAGDLTVTDQNDSPVTVTADHRRAAARHLGGHMYRIGDERDRPTGLFGLFPGNAFAPETFVYPLPGNTGIHKITINRLSQPVSAYIVGRNRDPATNEFDGPVMDVAFYTSFITLN